MTNEEEQEVVRSVFRAYINDLKAHSTKTDRPTFKMLEEVKDKVIKALEQRPCEDCISRQAVLDMATTIQTDDFSGNEIIEVVDVDDIKALPSVTPTRPTGKWILKRTFPTKMYDEYLNEYECSECHRGIRCTDAQLVNYPYCHCGARMEGCS